VKSLAGWEEEKAEFKGKDSEFVSGAESAGEGLPVDGFQDVVAPVKSLMHVLF
jgi:hypothetical protein